MGKGDLMADTFFAGSILSWLVSLITTNLKMSLSLKTIQAGTLGQYPEDALETDCPALLIWYNGSPTFDANTNNANLMQHYDFRITYIRQFSEDEELGTNIISETKKIVELINANALMPEYIERLRMATPLTINSIDNNPETNGSMIFWAFNKRLIIATIDCRVGMYTSKS